MIRKTILLCCLSITACSEDRITGPNPNPDTRPDAAAPDTTPAPTGPATYVEYRRKRAELECKKSIECGFVDQQDEAVCIQDYELPWPRQYDIAARVEAGGLQYDRDAAQRCLDAIPQLACNYWHIYPEVCENVAKAAVQSGGMCSADSECVGGGLCGTFDTPGCKSTCSTPVGVGMDCKSSACDSNSYCQETTMGETTQSRCVARPDRDQACEGADECKEGLVCVPNTDYQSGKCGSRGQMGSPCFWDEWDVNSTCEPGLVCDGTQEKPKCTALKNMGEKCANEEACGPRLKCTGLVFTWGGEVHTQGTCILPVATGGNCEDDDACKDYHGCIDGKCKHKYASGESCADESIETGPLCSFGYCDPKDNTCKPYLKIGDMCDTSDDANGWQCPGWSFCSSMSKTCKVDCS